MVGTVLSVILDDEDQGRIGRLSSGDALDHQAQRIIIVGHLRLDRIHPVDGLVEIPEMIVGETK